MVRRSWSSPFVVALVVAVVPAAAEDDPEALVQKGIELRKSQHDAEALEVFRLAYGKAKTPRILAQIALAEQALGLWLEAETDLEAALAHAQDPWIQKNADALGAALETIRGHLAWIVPQANVEGGELRVNGRSVGKLPLARVRTAAGTNYLELAAPGYETARRTISLTARAEVKVDLVLVPGPTAAAPGPEVVQGPPLRVLVAPSPWTKVGVATVSVGVFSLGLGTFFTVRTLDRKHTRDAHCTPLGCDPDGVTADREARFASTMSAVTLGVGLVATAAGVFFLVRGRSSDVAVTSAVGPSSASLAVRLSW